MILKLIDLDGCTHYYDNIDSAMVIRKEYALPKTEIEWSPDAHFFLNPDYFKNITNGQDELKTFYYNEVILYKDKKKDESTPIMYDPHCSVYLLNNQGKTIERL